MPLNGTFDVNPTTVTPGICCAFSVRRCQNVVRASGVA